MLRWEQTEFLLKGVYLGLLLIVAWQMQNWLQVAEVFGITFGVLAVCLAAAAVQKLREGYRVRGRLAGFVLFLILENPGLVFTGMILGLSLGTYYVFGFWDRQGEASETWLEVAPAIGGAVLGLVFWNLREKPDRRFRMWGSFVLAVTLVGAAIYYLSEYPDVFRDKKDAIAYLLLLGLPGFYLLTFASLVEESEIEIGAMCAALGISLWILAAKLGPNVNFAALILPLGLYFVYTRRILPDLRVFKHVLRGMCYAHVGRHRPALLSLTRAMELNPNNSLAREQLWNVYKGLDVAQIASDPDTLAVVNFELCLERVAWLLLQDRPRPEQIDEALRLLDLVADHRPALVPRCQYWRAVAYCFQKKFDEAASALESVLAAPAEDTPPRRAILLAAWQLALVLHPEMIRRVGTPLIAQPQRRLEAIAAVERRLAKAPDDQDAWTLKRLVYGELTEAQYQAVCPDHAAPEFDHEYLLQLGLALVENKDQWQRGCEYLRLAARGLPSAAPVIFLHIAKAHEKRGDFEGKRRWIDRAKQAARAVGVKNLADDDRQAVFAAVKWLGDAAMAGDNLDEAIDCFKFYSQYDRAGLETYRTLAELFERRAKRNANQPERYQDDIWWALNCTEHALSYDSKDQDLVARKDRYYFSVTPAELRRRIQEVYKWFDADYCKQKARWILDKQPGDLDLLDWASHLADLAQAYDPDSHAARLLRARILRQRGESDESRKLLEQIRASKPEKFPSAEEEEAWYLANRYLGEMYVDDKPDQAVQCLLEYKKAPKSGANTLYHLGRAYENLGDRSRAAKYYEQVTAYEGNPLVYEAQDALSRLRENRTDAVS